MVKIKRHSFVYAPLSKSFFITGIIGFLISAVYFPKIDITWAFTFGVLFLMMILAAFISMTKAAPEPQL
ncbi:MAG: hypothetical protein HY363_02705 [Candidatus Aenigmarchaeota archaeon]|nr:hypothetical protein [Candidatus Aenigmarchaeota archaeon]